ncbi:ABC transporter ATP-binding protein [Chitinophaga agri]|uniref:ABC transporter ATP-binding protein n=1 Tax=Chitinophaga agri TaxID=2703787 RepID=A0A6B9ZFK8_9BACT|nr:ABC transporter ATP-binding protein [Chitinophaga agri]QHS59333.1 ABC transporter ATP-binding protein [Chitinophaga agri]
MKKTNKPVDTTGKGNAGLMSLLRPYRGQLYLLIFMALVSNLLNLVLPALTAKGIDAYSAGTLDMRNLILEFAGAAFAIFIFTYLQSMIQTYMSEGVARQLRTDLAARISRQDYAYIQQVNPSKLLTNLTGDVDSIKLFVSQAVISIASSVFMIVGCCILMIRMDWKLGLTVLSVVPFIAFAFAAVLKKVRTTFKKSREVVDKLNKTINESITGAALVRVINAQQQEYDRFIAPNGESMSLGIAVVRLFAGLVPVISFLGGMATLFTLVLGGHFVIEGEMTLGDIAAFNSYIALLIFPIIVIGFMSNLIAQASASYKRIAEVLHAPEPDEKGTVTTPIKGDLSVENISLSMDGKPVLKDVTFSVRAGTRTAIIGPTAAGKTQLLNVIAGLLKPDNGNISYDNLPLQDYDKTALLQQVGLVFQDSIVFNMSLRENIAFNENVSEALMKQAIATAELKEFVSNLPQGLDTIVSERGNSLSGGQKQRIMLARALAINPQILLLDDFTARVDNNTEQRILENVQENYPHLTLISVTQKIASVAHFDQIILLMDGEVVAAGSHDELLQTCPEYVQIFNSQRSTSNYELQPE